MINKLLFLKPNNLLIARKNLELYSKSKRFKANKLIYRNIGEKQTAGDWYGSTFLISFVICCMSINAYMNWDEYKLENPHGWIDDYSTLTSEELGIPDDDSLGYAPIKKEIYDIGTPARSEKLLDYNFRYRKGNEQPNPYNM